MSMVGDIAYKHTAYLSEQIGCRPIGTPANHMTARYIAGQFEAAGLAVEFQEFACPDWSEEQAELVLSQESLQARANTFSPACDLEAPSLPVGTLAELQAAQIGGKILVFYGELAQRELAAKGAIYVPESDRVIVEILEAGRPDGLIMVNPAVHGMWRLVEDYDFEIPSVTVSALSGLHLLRQAGELVRMRIATRRSPSHSANVIGRLHSVRPQRIVLCAHYDTKVDTPGAYDNAAGVGAILTLAQRLSKTSHNYSLEWLAISGEEIYGLGDMEYATRIAGNFDQVQAVINFDGIGPYTAANSLAIFAASERFTQLIRRLKVAFPGIAEVEPWPASDHYIFYSNGVPSIAFSSVGMKDIYHTPEDTIDWISPEKLGEVVILAEQIIKELDGREPRWGRP